MELFLVLAVVVAVGVLVGLNNPKLKERLIALLAKLKK